MNESCAALQKNKVDKLPVKSKKVKVTKRFFNYIIFEDENQNTIVQKREGKGIWENLYEFPVIETDAEINLKTFIRQIRESNIIGNEIVSVSEFQTKKQIHKLTHQHLNIKFRKVKIKGILPDGIDYNTLKTFPFPIVIYNFLEKEFLR